jgi:uncharacterized membrane protein
MDSQVAVYDSQKKAMRAIMALNKSGFLLNQISLIGKAEIIMDDLHIKSYDSVKNIPVLIGSGAGVIAGLLTGIGVFAIPGFGFLYGAGALIGILAGFDVGIISGGIASVLIRLGINKDSVIEYEEHLNKGMFMLVIHGSLDEIKKAEKILHTDGAHLEWGNNKRITMNN